MKRHEGPQLAFDFGAEPEAPAPSPSESAEPLRKPRSRAPRPPAEGAKVAVDALPLALPLDAPSPPREPVDAVRADAPSSPRAKARPVPASAKRAREPSPPRAFDTLGESVAPAAAPSRGVAPREIVAPPRAADEAPSARGEAHGGPPRTADERRHDDGETDVDLTLVDEVPFELLEARDVDAPPPFDEGTIDEALDDRGDAFELPVADPSAMEGPWSDGAAVEAPLPAALADIVFVVPTGRHVERFVLAGYEATTFPELEERLLARLTDLGVATRAEERAFLAAVIEELDVVHEIDGMEISSAPFCDAFLDAVEDVARALGSFRRARGECPDVARKRVGFLIDLDARLDRALLEGGLVARRKVPAVLAERIALSAPAVVEEALGARALETRLVVDLAPLHLVLVRALEVCLASRGGRATVCLPMHDRPFDSERTPDPLERVSTWALALLEDAPRTVPLEPRLGTLDATPVTDAAVVTGVSIRLAASTQAEAHAVVSAVAEALAAGARVEAVAIGVLRLDEAFEAELGKAFAAAGIVAHGTDHERSMLPPFLSEALAALDKTDARMFSRLISSSYVDLGLPAKEARAHLGALARKMAQVPNVVASTARAAARVAVARASRPSARVEERDRDLALVDRAFGAFESFPSFGTPSALAVATLDWLVTLGVPTRASRSDVALFAQDDLDTIATLEAAALARDARAWEAFETALAEVEHAAIRAGRGDVEVSRGRFFEEVLSIYRPSPPLPGASRAFAVRVAKRSALADDDLDLLVVPTATTAGLGAPPMRSALLSKEILVALGYDPEVAVAKGLSELALAATRAARVVFTACEGDDDESSPVSPIVSALREHGAEVVSFGRGSRLEAPLSVLDATLLRLLAGERPRDPEALARVEIEREREGFFLSERRPMSSVVGLVGAASALEVLADESGREKPLALTGLERLAECAFRGYAHILLGAREPMEDAELPTARDEGTRLHGALFVALTAVRELLRAKPRDVDTIVAKAEAAAAAYLADVETKGPLEPLLDRRVRAVVRAVARDAATDERFVFEVGEQAFGEAGASSWPPLVLGEGEDAVRLRGRIDRVDVGALRASARVVDYKRGRLDDLARKLGTTALQVPLYALSARAPLDVDDVSGIYYSLRDDELLRPNEKARGEEIVATLLADRTVERTVLAVVGRLRAGDVAPRPPNETLCRTCGLAGGCRRPRFAMPAEEEEGGGGTP